MTSDSQRTKALGGFGMLRIFGVDPARENIRSEKNVEQTHVGWHGLAAAIEIHRHTGAGLLASSYEECLCYELGSPGLKFERKKEIALRFDGSLLKTKGTIPLIVEGEIPVFPISTEQDPTLTRATALARLRQGNWKVGLVLNFNSRTMAEGIQRLSV